LKRCLAPLRRHESESGVDWNIIEANWMQYKRQVKAFWGELTIDEIDMIAGCREQLAGKIRDTYGISLEKADRHIQAFQNFLKDSAPS
jgi:uncharacterized protein YjbJ (UPF0337 family)